MILSFNDKVMLFNNNLLLHRDRLSFITFNRRETMSVFDLETQKSREVAFVFEDLQPIKSRLGLVNINNTIVWLSRLPVRKYGVGLYRNNTIAEVWKTPESPEVRAEARERVHSLTAPQIIATVEGRYPTFYEALRSALANRATVAFSNSMAVTSARYIMYRDRVVGSVSEKATSCREIVFKPPFAYLTETFKKDA